MNGMRYVYLFELDSVRKSDEEVLVAQQALYDEIVGNGNCVVLSLNQLTDSRAIMSMLHSDEQAKILLQLFQAGYIKYARFGKYRTPSNYIQKSIEENRSFIYSSLPLKSNQYRLQDEVRLALKYADLARFSDLIKKQETMEQTLSVFDEYHKEQFVPSNLTKEEALATLRYLKRFVELIIQTSMYDDYVLPAIAYTEQYPPVSFEMFMDLILSFISEDPEFLETQTVLKEIKEELKEAHRNSNSRSEWILLLYKRKGYMNDQILALGEYIIHLCYNYTVEYSLYMVSKHYEADSLFEKSDSFQTDFFTRLEHDRKMKYSCMQEESNQFQWFSLKDQGTDWRVAIQMIYKRNKPFDEKENGQLPLYENMYWKRRKQQRNQNYFLLMRLLIATLFSLVPIVLYAWIDDETSAISNQLISQLFHNDAFKIVIMFIVANLMSVIMEQIGKVSNIWEVIKGCGHACIDFWHLSHMQVCSYVNWGETDSLRYEVSHESMENRQYESVYLERYQQLWRTKEKNFKQHALLPLVDPLKDPYDFFDFEQSHHQRLGVVYESPYYLHIVDLIRYPDGVTPYERLLAKVEEGAIVAVVLYQGKFVLIQQFRHAIRREQLSFIRGFGEKNRIASENVKTEIMEEIQGKCKGEPIDLGNVTPDSGILGTTVSVYCVEITEYSSPQIKEGIKEIVLMDKQELELAIQQRQITDGFTLSAYLLYQQWLKKDNIFTNKSEGAAVHELEKGR